MAPCACSCCVWLRKWLVEKAGRFAPVRRLYWKIVTEMACNVSSETLNSSYLNSTCDVICADCVGCTLRRQFWHWNTCTTTALSTVTSSLTSMCRHQSASWQPWLFEAVLCVEIRRRIWRIYWVMWIYLYHYCCLVFQSADHSDGSYQADRLRPI